MGKPKAKIPLKAHQQQPLSGSSDGNLGTLKQCCLHYSFEGKGHLRRSLLDILASIHDEPCQLCPQESVVTKQDVGSLNNKKKQKHKKKEGSGAAKLKISTWICLTCGGYFCIEAGIKAASHSRMHAMHTDHWWAAKSNDPSSIYCFKCDSEVPLNLSSVVDKEVRTVVPDSRFFIQGFQTLGSVSCFNAILQNFLSLKLLRQKILALEFPRAAHIAIALRDLVARTSDSRILVVLSQEILLSKICSRYPDFRSNRMMDSEESFRCFIDALQTEEKESWAGVYEAIDSTIVDSVFIGHCSIELSCKKCHYHFIRDEEFFYLPLPVLSSNVSIEDCLAQYTDSETWLCEKCANSEGNLGDATKRLLINVPPPVLVLYLKSSHDQSKQTKVRVQYKAHLDIGPFVDPSSRVDGEIVYHLAGAVLHNETMTGGHYIANVRAEKENLKGSALCWFNASDDQVRRTSFELFEGEPHLLFYQKPMAQNMVKEDAKVIAKVKAAQEDSDCKEPAPNHMERHPEQVETPLPLVLEMVEGSHVIKGLRNIQYSCFFNVMLQILLALDPLRRKMLGTDVRRGPLAEFLRQFFTDTSASSPARGPLDPEDFFKSVCLVCPGFKIGRMEDSHELLGLFLSYLREEEANARQISMNIPIHKAKTFVNSIFLGRCSSTVTSIQCDHCSSQFDPFLDISLAIPQRSCPVSIEDCWDSYTEPESVQDGWVCPHCTNAQGMPDAKPVRRNSMKKLLIADAPSVLVVTLKRFQYDHSTQVSRKLQDHVNFKELFDMRRFMTKRSVNTTTMYRLVGVVQHSGDLEGGHYIAYVRANKMESQKHTNTDCKSWFYASDETIREVCLDDLLRCEAYILVYEKCLTFQSSGNPTDEERQVADINMQPHSSHSSGNRMGDASLFAGTKMQPQAAASISDSTPLPQDEKCLISESSGNPTDEECQVADIKMQAQTGASIGDSSPLPQDEVHLWEYPRTRNPLKKEINAIATKNGLVGKNVVLFLDRFILQGDKKPFYHCELVTMCERGSGSRELNIHYSHLLQFSKVLAMDVCNGYQRLRQNLKEAAITFAQKLLDKDLNLTSGGRNRMHELASTDPDSSLELKFLEMPQMHEQLTDGLRPPLSQPMHVYGHDWGGYAIRRPFPEKCARVQKLVGYVISNHRDGFSWDGDFTIEDIDLYDDKVFIRKEPKSFPIHPRISQEMICAMQKDFSRIKESVLKEFKCLEGPIPYFHAFSELFGGMESYADWWSKEETAEALRELIEHHPFLKPAMARSHLWSGIFGACRSHDAGDVTALFKDILWSNRSSDSWTTKARQSENRMIKNVIRHKDKVKPEVAAAEPEPAAATAAAAQPAAAPAAAAELAAAEPEAEDGSKMVLYYGDNYELLFEFLRHLCQHGSAYSFQFRPSGEHVNRPRNQLMKSLDEPEVAGSHILEEDMVEALTLLLRHSGMTGLLESVWDCYKSCNYPLRPQRRNH